MKRKCKTFCSILVCVTLGLSLAINPIHSAQENTHSKTAICVNDQHIFLLQPKTNTIEVYSLSQKKITEFSALPPYQSASTNLVDIQCTNTQLYVLDQTLCSISVFDISDMASNSGLFLFTIPHCSDILQNPTSLCIHNETLYVSDNQSIISLTPAGEFLQFYHSPSTNRASVITGVSYGHELTCIVDNHSIFSWNTYSNNWNQQYSSYGTQWGNFQYCSAFVSDGNHYVYDQVRQTVYVFNCLLQTWNSIPALKQKNIQDFSLLHNQLLYVQTDTKGFQSFSLQSLSTEPSFELSNKKIKFERSYQTSISKYLYLWSPTGVPLHGTIKSSHPGIHVHPTSFSEANIDIDIDIYMPEFPNTSTISESITIYIDNEKPIEIPIDGSIVSGKPYIHLVNSRNSIFYNKYSTVQLRVEQNKDFSDALEFEFLPSVGKDFLNPESTTLQYPDKEWDTVSFKCNPIAGIKPGFYPLTLKVTSPKNKIAQVYSFQVLVQKPIQAQTKTVLGELFTAHWCGYCPSAERAMDEILQEKDTTTVNFVNYFIECIRDEQLCSPTTEKRKMWYEVTSTPVAVFNGIEKVVGGIRSKTESVAYKYNPVVEELSLQSTSFLVNGWVQIKEEPSEDTEGSLQIQSIIETSDAIEKESDIRLLEILVENNVVRPTWHKNDEGEIVEGETTYHHVYRSMVNDEGVSLQTLPKIDTNRRTHTSKLVVPSYVQLENCYVLQFLQDFTTKEILQTQTISLVPNHTEKTMNESTLISCHKIIPKKDTNTIQADFIVRNLSANYKQYELTWDMPKGTLLDHQLTVEGMGVLSGNTLLLPPFQSSYIKLSGSIQTEEKSNQLLFYAKDLQTDNKMYCSTMIQSHEQQNWVQFLYPKTDNLSTLHPPLFCMQIPQGSKVFVADNDSAMHIDAFGYVFFTPKLEPGSNTVNVSVQFPDNTKQTFPYSIYNIDTLEVKPGDLFAKFDGEKEPISNPVIIRNSRSLGNIQPLIMRMVPGSFGYDAVTKGLTIAYKDTSISLFMNKTNAYINGKEIVLDTPPIYYYRGAYFPLRIVFETFDYKVLWNSKSHSIIVTNEKE